MVSGEPYIRHIEGKGEELHIDKRTLPKSIPSNFKHLRYSRKLPIDCNSCPHRAKEVGGNGICKVYQQDSLCTLRADIRKQTEKYHTRDGRGLLPLLEEELDAQMERLKVFDALEGMAGILNPEISKRLNSVNNLAKIVNELKTKETTVSLTEKKILSPEERDQIATEIERMMSVTTKSGGL